MTDYTTAAASTTITVNPGTAAEVNLIVNKVLTRSAGQVVVPLTISNTGQTAAANVVLTGVKVGSDSTTSVPQIIGTHGRNFRPGDGKRSRFGRRIGRGKFAYSQWHLCERDVRIERSYHVAITKGETTEETDEAYSGPGPCEFGTAAAKADTVAITFDQPN
jgi:hypothetical protein